MKRSVASLFRLTFTGSILLCGLALADESGKKRPKNNIMTRVQIIVGTEAFTATLDDTSFARDFAAMLPLNVVLRDYHATEKIADLPRRLDTTGAPARYAPEVGDITYYAPWGNLAIFYKPFQNSAGFIRLGQFDGSINALLKSADTPVRIESAEIRTRP
jgi:hypothetical protein